MNLCICGHDEADHKVMADRACWYEGVNGWGCGCPKFQPSHSEGIDDEFLVPSDFGAALDKAARDLAEPVASRDDKGECPCPTCKHQASAALLPQPRLKQAESTDAKPSPSMPVDSIRKALKKSFTNLYVRQFTTDWQTQRLIRSTEIDVMDLAPLQALIKEAERNAVIGELTNLGLAHWQKPIPEKALLDRIKGLKSGSEE